MRVKLISDFSRRCDFTISSLISVVSSKVYVISQSVGPLVTYLYYCTNVGHFVLTCVYINSCCAPWLSKIGCLYRCWYLIVQWKPILRLFLFVFLQIIVQILLAYNHSHKVYRTICNWDQNEINESRGQFEWSRSVKEVIN